MLISVQELVERIDPSTSTLFLGLGQVFQQEDLMRRSSRLNCARNLSRTFQQG